ncbi:hypothetical protein RND71_040573 [Anisodus tanguticus]|uniref:Uncharacterized protein n=1 Tax=Anisodus tanguticus TaxID=243964 RepID=A0AAE1QT93_9SOLA|nr:hypothetical protein RND71_040573 [Anisodus tanguticus]
MNLGADTLLSWSLRRLHLSGSQSGEKRESSVMVDKLLQFHEKETSTILVMSDCEKDLEVLRETYKSGKTKEESWRRSQLKNLLRLLEEKEDDIFKALKQDLGKHQVEAYRDEQHIAITELSSDHNQHETKQKSFLS